MRNGVRRFLLFTGLGALVAMLILFFGREPSTPPIIAPVRESALAPSVPLGTAAAEPSSDSDVERGVVDGVGVSDVNEVRSAVQAVAPIITDAPATAATRAADDRPAATARRGSGDSAGVPLSWCSRTRSGLIWRDARGLASDTSVVWQGSASARLSVANESVRSDNVGVMWQAVVATSLRGKRIEMSAAVRPRMTWVGHLFVRTQAKVPFELWVSDQGVPGARGINRYLPRNEEWTRYTVVHDIPSDAEVIYYGFALYGGGDVWIDDVRINVVDEASALTHYGSVAGNPSIQIDPSWVLSVPLNLDFELRSDGPTGSAEASDQTCFEPAN